MKKCAAFIVALLLIFHFMNNHAEKADMKDGTVPTVYGIDDNIKCEWEKLSGDGNHISDLSPLNKAKSDILQSEEGPDIINIITSTEPINELINSGLIAAIIPTSELSEDIDSMPNIVKRAFMDNFVTEGMYYGFPYDITISAMGFWVPEAWAGSPFDDMDPPSSFTELLDFIEHYLDTPHDGYCFFYDRFQKGPGGMIDLLMDCWIIQCRASGNELFFSDSQFVSLAERTREIAARLYNAESNKKTKKQHQLFTENFKGYTENGMDTFTWDNLIPWRITSDQVPYVHVDFWLYCFSRNSEFAQIGAKYLKTIISDRSRPYCGKTNWIRYLYCHPDQIDVQAYNNQILSEDGSKWKCLFMTQEFLDSIYRIDQYAVPCIVDRTEYQYFKTYLCSKATKAINDFKKGITNGTEFAAQLDELNR